MSKTQTATATKPAETTTGNNEPSLADVHMHATEVQERYQSAGPVYAGVNVVGDLGLELGIQTGEGSNIQRSGFGFYLRSDHMAKRKPALSLFAMANPDYEAATAG